MGDFGFRDMAALRTAERNARRLYPRSKAFRGVYVAGARAKLEGRTPDACPYPRDPGKTWRNSYRRCWLAGHRAA